MNYELRITNDRPAWVAGDKLMAYVGGVMLGAGMIFAGSEGDWFPWVNFAAVAVMVCGARIVCRFE